MSLNTSSPSTARQALWRGVYAAMQAWRAARQRQRRKRVTRELVSASPYLLRDIGLTEDRLVRRRR